MTFGYQRTRWLAWGLWLDIISPHTSQSLKAESHSTVFKGDHERSTALSVR